MKKINLIFIILFLILVNSNSNSNPNSNQHERFQIATNQQQIYNKREELNNRMSSFQPMPSAQPLSDGKVDVGVRPVPQMSL